MTVLADDPGRWWTEPGVFRVAEGVHRIPLPLPDDGLRAVNVYVVQSGPQAVLIDSGQMLDVARDLLEQGLRELDLTLGDVGQFLVTHYHRDHYTLAVSVRRELGQSVSLGAGEADSLAYHRSEGAVSGSLAPQVAELRICGAATLADQFIGASGEVVRDGLGTLPANIWEDPDVWLVDDLPIAVGGRTLRAVATPGHTQGHFVFHEQAHQLLFAGDHVLPHITPSIGFEGVPAPYPLRDYLGSLATVRSMSDARLLPAHGPVIDSAHARIDQLLEHHDQRLGACHRGVAAGASSAWEVASRLTWTRRDHALSDLDAVNAMLAVLETKAHLDVLVLRQELTAQIVEGVARYAG
jgi:glyoxylase-like metal-dependent hydrolase (beta-lactamase superfamily II)